MEEIDGVTQAKPKGFKKKTFAATGGEGKYLRVISYFSDLDLAKLLKPRNDRNLVFFDTPGVVLLYQYLMLQTDVQEDISM